jgi:regulator of RNase E activity RraA
MQLLRQAGASVVGDALGRMGGVSGLKRYDSGHDCLVARALTVETRAGDNLAIHVALGRARPGDVLIVAGGNCLERALVGELSRSYAIHRGMAGFVIDGAVRDVGAFRGPEPFACFARGNSHRGPSREGPGRIGSPVVIGSQVIGPGDIVVADEDGVVCFDASRLYEVTKLVAERLVAEASMRAEISTGKVQQSWIEAAVAKWQCTSEASLAAGVVTKRQG